MGPTHICGWVGVLAAVHFTLNLPSGKSFAREDNSVHPQHVNRDTLQPSDRIVIPTEVEGPAVSLPAIMGPGGTKGISNPGFIPRWSAKTVINFRESRTRGRR
jgi:hypothetical protein